MAIDKYKSLWRLTHWNRRAKMPSQVNKMIHFFSFYFYFTSLPPPLPAEEVRLL
jgi:hypothetical protein